MTTADRIFRPRGSVPQRRNVSPGTRWRVNTPGFHERNLTFRGDGSFDYSPVTFEAGGDDAVLENCDFIDCFRGPTVAGAKRVRLVNCTVRFTEYEPSALTAQYGFYCSAGETITYEGCIVENPRLDGFKTALGVYNVKYIGCHVEEAGVVGVQEGGAFDLYASGDRVQLVGCSSKNCYGTSLTIKTHTLGNPPGVVGDIEVMGYRSEGDFYGMAFEAVDALDYPTPPEYPGVRTEAQRINVIGGIVKNSGWNGVLCNTRFVTLAGLQIHGAHREGLYLMRNARDINISDVNVVACSNGTTGPALAGVKMNGAQRVTMRGGVIDGADGDGTHHIVPIVLTDRNAENLLDDIVISDVRFRNWTTEANTMPILCASATAKVLVDVWGAGDPNGTPGMHGSHGSRYRRTSNGAQYMKTSAANVKTGWVECSYG